MLDWAVRIFSYCGKKKLRILAVWRLTVTRNAKLISGFFFCCNYYTSLQHLLIAQVVLKTVKHCSMENGAEWSGGTVEAGSDQWRLFDTRDVTREEILQIV